MLVWKWHKEMFSQTFAVEFRSWGCRLSLNCLVMLGTLNWSSYAGRQQWYQHCCHKNLPVITVQVLENKRYVKQDSDEAISSDNESEFNDTEAVWDESSVSRSQNILGILTVFVLSPEVSMDWHLIVMTVTHGLLIRLLKIRFGSLIQMEHDIKDTFKNYRFTHEHSDTQFYTSRMISSYTEISISIN
jgi:hypothetical protein